MPNNLILSDVSPNGNIEAYVEQDDRVVYFYLNGSPEEEPEQVRRIELGLCLADDISEEVQQAAMRYLSGQIALLGRLTPSWAIYILCRINVKGVAL